MLLAKYKSIIPMLLALVFTGQVLASAVLSCQSQTPEAEFSSSMIDHSQHMSMDAPSADTEFSIECCVHGDCNFSSCTATAVLPAIEPLLLTRLSTPRSQYNERAINPQAIPLFRPPISA